MDKETLSNYGWIVICVLILAVMIALATPFGSFISEAVQSTTAGFFSVNQNALDAAGIAIPGQNFDVPDMNANGEASQPAPAPTLTKNAYGFYYDAVYHGVLEDDGRDYGHSYIKDFAVIFKENGTMLIFEDTTEPAVILQSDSATYTVNGNIINCDGFTLTISADGKTMEYDELFNVYFGNITLRTDIVPSGVKYETVYTEAWDENVKVVFHSNNTITRTNAEGISETYEIASWSSDYKCNVRGLGTIRLGLEENKVSCDIR